MRSATIQRQEYPFEPAANVPTDGSAPGDRFRAKLPHRLGPEEPAMAGDNIQTTSTATKRKVVVMSNQELRLEKRRHMPWSALGRIRLVCRSVGIPIGDALGGHLSFTGVRRRGGDCHPLPTGHRN